MTQCISVIDCLTVEISLVKHWTKKKANREEKRIGPTIDNEETKQLRGSVRREEYCRDESEAIGSDLVACSKAEVTAQKQENGMNDGEND